MTYLEELLEAQRVEVIIQDALRARRQEIEQALTGGWAMGQPRFYYGGSYAKRTLIAAHFDLDVVIYFAAGDPKELYEAVERRLRGAGHLPKRHNVSLRLGYTPGLHIDVVPGRAVDDTYYYAELYSSTRNATRRTSLKAHIDLARSGDRDTIKLLKLWRCRHGLPVGSFVLELAAARALAGAPSGCGAPSLEDKLERVMQFLAESFLEARLVDPANPDHVVTDDVRETDKAMVASAAEAACRAPGWEWVVW
jgi:hypothetical protein